MINWLIPNWEKLLKSSYLWTPRRKFHHGPSYHPCPTFLMRQLLIEVHETFLMRVLNRRRRVRGPNTGSQVDDVELQSLSSRTRDANTLDRYLPILRCIFALQDDQLRTYVGAGSYCRYLESCFGPLLTENYSGVWSMISKPKPKSAVDCWHLFEVAWCAARAMNEDTSLEEIWVKICSVIVQGGSSTVLPQNDNISNCGIISLFSVICWATMTMQPVLDWSKLDESPRLLVRQQPFNQDSVRMDYKERPVKAIFRHFRRAMNTSQWRHPIGVNDHSGSASLEVSCLNFASLSEIAKISLTWVNDLTCHLDFDATKRQLSVFRFPTFCVLRILGEQEEPHGTMMRT